MLRKTVYPKIENALTQGAGYLHKKGFTPNQVTLAGCALNLLSGWIYASGHFFIAGLIMGVACLADLFDGSLARLSGKISKFGALLDSTVDRYSDFFLFGGVAVYYARHGSPVTFIVTLGVILGALVTSYAKARAENLIPDCNVGFFERAERLIVLGIGSAYSPLMPLMMWVLLFGTHYTAIHRVLHTKKVLSNSESAS